MENREALSGAVGGGQAVGAVAKIGGEHWKALSAEERAPFEARAAEKKAEYQQALSEFLAAGGVQRSRTRRQQADADQRPAKRPWGGAYGEYTRQHRQEVRRSLPAEAQLQEVTRECAKRWKELPEELKQSYQDAFQARLDEFNATHRDAAPTGVTRSATVTQGAAKGWKVQAWMNSRSALQFRIFEPRQSGRAFRTFNNFKALRGNVDKKVYRQLSQLVKPGLVRRLTDRAAQRAARAAPARAAAPLQDETPPKRQRGSGEEDGAIVQAGGAGPRGGRARGTPDRLDRPLMATQSYFPPDAPRLKERSWTSACEARLVRHQRCLASEGPQQPQVIYLRGTTTVGRAESNDVVLNSARTPQMLSRCHAKLTCEEGPCGGAFSLTDQGSTNGILVNGVSLQGTCQLKSGDVVTFGVQTPLPEFDYVFETRAA